MGIKLIPLPAHGPIANSVFIFFSMESLHFPIENDPVATQIPRMTYKCPHPSATQQLLDQAIFFI